MTDYIERTEVLQPEPAQALGALLDLPVPDLEREGLPLLWHWVYLLDRPAQGDLGADGHPLSSGTPEPPGPGRRRMWAGGQLRARGALRCGEPATKRSRVRSVQEKQGRSGSLTFVVVEHHVLQSGRLVVDERQDIVYRHAAPGSTPSEEERPIVAAAADAWSIDVSPTLLFRFSALTYNAHRIHYDRDYARDVEGYPGLLTHGPLQALAMAEAARAQGGAGDRSFAYRLTAPLFDHQGMVVEAVREQGGVSTAVRDLHGRRTAEGLLGRIG